MKIAIVLHSLGGGGAERVATRLASRWCEDGHSVALITIAGKQHDRYELDPRARRIGLALDSPSRHALHALVANAGRLSRLRRALRQEQPDVAVALMSTPSTQLALLGRIAPVMLGSERSHPPMLPLRWPWPWIRRYAYARLDAVVALTQESARWLREHTKARRVEVIGNPVVWPMPEHSPVLPPETLLPPERKVLLVMGRLAPEKQPEHALEAFARLAPSRPQWDLVMLGEGPLQRGLQARAEDMGMSARVHLPGRVGNVGAWCGRAQLYLMTSRFEGFPNTLAEAMAAGCAAVSYDCDTGPRDLIRDGVDGVLVPPGDRTGLERTLATLMDDDVLRERMGSRACEVRERFSIDTVARQWRRLAGKANRPAAARSR